MKTSNVLSVIKRVLTFVLDVLGIIELGAKNDDSNDEKAPK